MPVVEANPFPPFGAADDWQPANTAALRIAAQRDVLEEMFGPAMDGASFVLGDLADIEPLWGTDEATLWSAGEALMIFGPQGVGKTTLVQRLTLARLGLADELLGLPVAPCRGRVLYLAMDRPRQAARSMRRMVGQRDAEVLTEQLRVWLGPLPFTLAADPSMLAAMAHHVGADTVIVDSLKDLAPGLSSDEVGAMVNTAFQRCLADGVEVISLHHPRKATQADGRRILSIDDVYGSTWLTSGHGSVLCLQQGRDPDTVTVTQLKTVNTELPPTDLVLNGTADTLTPTVVVATAEKLRTELVGAPDGLSVKAAARAMFAAEDAASIEKARRALEKLVKDQSAVVVDDHRPGAPKIYRPSGEGLLRPARQTAQSIDGRRPSRTDED